MPVDVGNEALRIPCVAAQPPRLCESLERGVVDDPAPCPRYPLIIRVIFK